MTKEQATEFFNQLVKLQEQIDSLKQEAYPEPTPEPYCKDGVYGCECGCDSDEVETDEGAEQVILRRGESITPDQANVIVFTKAELVAFASILTERVVVAAKEAVTDTSLDTDSLVTLELSSWDNTINIELDKDTIVNSIHSEIDDTIDNTYGAVEIEVDDILRHMTADKED